MPAAPVRLLVALKPGPNVDEAVSRSLPGIAWAYAKSTTPVPLEGVDALLVGSVARELGPFNPISTPRLRLVQLIYTGVDGFPFERFPPPIEIAANVGAFAPFVAEHAVTLALSAARAIVPSQVQVRNHQLRPPPAIRVLWGRTAVVLGYGEIGKAIAQRVSGLGMRVLGLNRTGRLGPGCDAMYPAGRLHEALMEGDVVFDARPLTVSTRGTIGAAEFAAMRPQAIYVNVGRAGTADEEALYRHLVSHPEFRAAFDPWWNEDFVNGTFATRFPLTDLPNFLGSPHDAGFGPATERYAIDHALENLARYYRGEPPRYLVDRRDYPPASASAQIEISSRSADPL